MRVKPSLGWLAFIIISLLGFGGLFLLIIPKDKSVINPSANLFETPIIRMVALGDSLTQGVGDSTNQGGFVPLVAQNLEKDATYQVDSANFGVSGNTSQQILQRLKEEKAIEEAIKGSDFLVLTVGGNDILQTLKKHIAQLDLSHFEQARGFYQANLHQMIQIARSYRPQLPIYIFGLYNPFQLSFPDLTQMQTLIDDWNQETKELIANYTQVYFVPIDTQFSQTKTWQSDDKKHASVNEFLFSEDYFHPNNAGYRLMSEALLEKLYQTKEDWQ